MGTHHHAEHPWRVRVIGDTRGAGVLLDDRHVLTCAHVVGGGDERVSVASSVCQPEWSTGARVVPGSWVFRGGDTRRGDVALLELDGPAPCGAHAGLWCAPLSGGRVRAHGFPQAEPYGISVDAELAGDGGRGGAFGLLNRVHPDGQWIEPGYSGAGVMMLDGDHAGHVIGIIVARYRTPDARAAWMMPAETIREYLRDHIAPYVQGQPVYRLGGPDPDSARLPELGSGDVLRVALTRELKRLLTGGWAGTVVLPGGAAGAGTGWLLRLVRTADPATRAATSDAEFAAAPRDTVLGLGAIDAAFDARGKPVAEVRRYLAERFGLPADEPSLTDRLLRCEPPPALVITGADRAEAPGALLREVLRPLAVRARSRGVRLVLGFDGTVPESLPYEVSLDPEPLIGNLPPGPPGGLPGADVEARVAELEAAEAEAARLSRENEHRFRRPPALPPALVPRLRIRLAVARHAADDGSGPDPELRAIGEAAAAALAEATAVSQRWRRRHDCLEDLRHTLEVNRVRAARHFGAEDQSLGDLHDRAARALWQAPIDLTAARGLVDQFVAGIDRRIDEEDRG
ncbi:MAG TPA: serine protease [Streptosporangiaceae bacterium]|nr:serine protease [Streptosporangiaceae bacterium]